MKKIKRIQKRNVKIILKFIKDRIIKKLAIAIYDHGRDNIKFIFTESLSITRGVENSNPETMAWKPKVKLVNSRLEKSLLPISIESS